MLKMIGFISLTFLSFYTIYNSSFINVKETIKEESVYEEKTEEIENKIIDETIIDEPTAREPVEEVKKVIIEDQPIMKLEIPKLELNLNIYEKNSKSNNIDKNIIIMDESDYPDKEGGIVIIGGHSGVGRIAYFKKLNTLEIGDSIILTYHNIDYKYEVVDYYLDNKDGSITINYNGDNKDRLFLYTCNPNDKNNYLVIICEKK